VGIIGGGAAACSSDASRLSNPFTNPFGEPAATGSLPDDEPRPVAPLRTGRIQSEALGAPGASRPAPVASAIPAPAAPAPARVASVGSTGWSAQGGTRITVAKNDSLQQMATRYGVPASAILQANGLTSASQVTPGRELVIPSYSNVSGLNPSAAAMTARPARAVEERREDAKALEAREKEAKAQAQEKALEAKRLATKEKDARDAKEKEAKELAAHKAAEAKVAEEKARKLASVKDADKKQHVRLGQTPKVADAKAETKADKAREEAKTAAKAEAVQKLAEAKAARDAAKEAAKESAKQAAAERAKDKAAEKVAKAEPKVAAKAEVAKAEPKAPAKVEVAKAEPAKPEPAATGSVAAQADAENFRWPAKGRVISGYGTSGNEGINIALPEGTAVKAAEDGTVAYAGSDVKGYGKLVLVRHANGFVSAYAHNGELDVKPGDKVKRGQTIAKSGASGNVTSPQLHFEIRKSGAPVDPMSQLASN
jgi:murein DD-endopeptidase MepM/ murein hydrolase activator NlpD